MVNRLHRCRALAAGLLCVLAPLLVPVRAAERWLQVASPEVVVLTDGPGADAENLARELAAFRELFAQLVLGEEAPALPPTLVVLFKNERSFRQVKPAGREAAQRFDGLTVRFEGRAITALSSELDDRSRRRIAFHEGVHWMLDASGCRPPLWLNEGLAEVFSTFEISKDRFGCGDPVPGHVEFLREQKLWPLPRLFAVTARSPDYNEANAVGMFYAQSWALAHLLLFGEENRLFRRDAEARRILLRGDSAGVERLIAQRLGGSADAALAELRRYVSSGSYVRFSSPLRLPAQAEVRTRPAPPGEVELAFGLLLASSGREADAERHLRAAARALPADPRPHEGLAVVATHALKTNEAAEHYARAIALGSPSPYAQVAVAQEAMRAHSAGDVKAGSEPRAATWVQYFRQLVGKEAATPELATSFANALFLSPEFSAADCAEVEALAARFPESAELGHALALLWKRAGNDAAASAHFRAAAENPAVPAEVRSFARRMLEQERLEALLLAAGERLGAEDLAGVEALLTDEQLARMESEQRVEAYKLRQIAGDLREIQAARADMDARRFTQARDRLRRLIESPDHDLRIRQQARQWLAESRRLEIDRSYAERFNAAVEQMEAGEFARALLVFRSIADDAQSPERLRTEAQKRVAQIEQSRRK